MKRAILCMILLLPMGAQAMGIGGIACLAWAWMRSDYRVLNELGGEGYFRGCAVDAAASAGDLEFLKSAVRDDEHLKTRAFQRAAESGQRHVVDGMGAGADRRMLKEALIGASLRGCTEVVELLLSRGAPIPEWLVYAMIQEAHRPILRLFKQYGATIDMRAVRMRCGNQFADELTATRVLNGGQVQSNDALRDDSTSGG